MNRLGWALAGLLVGVGGVAALVIVGTLARGVSARDEPSRGEAWVARHLRHLAIPDGARRMVNPVSPTESTLAIARSHWADHCAVCHGNDGRGDTAIGRGLYPQAPDMRLEATQRLSDGELFFIIENGIRFTGMPGWGGGGPDADAETWHLVQFIRHLPALTTDELLEMEQLNPKTPAELADREETRDFLDGGVEAGVGGDVVPERGTPEGGSPADAPNPD